MKKTIQFLILSTLLISITTILSSFTVGDNFKSLKSGLRSPSDNTCELTVKTKYGSAAKSVKVSTDVSGGISCSGGRTFYTDSDGKVTLRWSSGCYLKHIFIAGKGYDVNFKDGGYYTVRMK